MCACAATCQALKSKSKANAPSLSSYSYIHEKINSRASRQRRAVTERGNASRESWYDGEAAGFLSSLGYLQTHMTSTSRLIGNAKYRLFTSAQTCVRVCAHVS